MDAVTRAVQGRIMNGFDIEIKFGEHITVTDTWTTNMIRNGIPL